MLMAPYAYALGSNQRYHPYHWVRLAQGLVVGV